MMKTPNHRLQPDANVVCAKVSDEETVLLHLKTEQYYTLNETGTRIWDLFAEGTSLADMAAAIEEVYDVSWEEAMWHVLALLEALKQEGLVQESTAE